MAELIGDAREDWGKEVWKQIENFANQMKSEEQPFYIVFSAKLDKPNTEKAGYGVFRQTIKAYYNRPPAMLGILVWYVNNKTGDFNFIPELSLGYDVPIDPSLLSEKASDALPTVMEKGEKMKVLLS